MPIGKTLQFQIQEGTPARLGKNRGHRPAESRRFLGIWFAAAAVDLSSSSAIHCCLGPIQNKDRSVEQLVDRITDKHAPESAKLGRTREAPVHCSISSFVSFGALAAVCGPGSLTPLATMGEMASRQPLLLRFKARAARLRRRWALVSPAYCYWQARFTPSIPINVSPSTSTRLGEHKMALCQPACITLRKPRTVSYGSYLFPPISTGSTASGFCPGVCLPVYRSIDR